MSSIPPTGPTPPYGQDPWQPQDNSAQYKAELQGDINEANQLVQDYQLGDIDTATFKSKLQDLLKKNSDLAQKIEADPNQDMNTIKLSTNISINGQFLNEALNSLNSGNTKSAIGSLMTYAYASEQSLQ